jgi:predicted Zn-ribbon and HTH transcriptional regulator
MFREEHATRQNEIEKMRAERSGPAFLRAVENRRLLFGPYSAPDVILGAQLLCECFGLRVVKGWYGPKQWPRANAKGRANLIVCGDLLHALQRETVDTVALHWGVHRRTALGWRKRLGFHKNLTFANSAFKSIRVTILRETSPEIYRDPLGRALATFSKERRSAMGKAAAGKHAWTESEAAVVRQLPNREAAAVLGRSLKAVMSFRTKNAIPAPHRELLCRYCGFEWVTFKTVPPTRCNKCHRKDSAMERPNSGQQHLSRHLSHDPSIDP